MKFIPKDHKIARLWVEALASSANIDKTTSASMFANLCGFKTWDKLISLIGANTPSRTDEEVDKATLLSRKDFYMSVLVRTHSISPYHAARIIDQLSPSSNRLPKKFSFDANSMHDPEPDDVMHLFPPNFDFDQLLEGSDDVLRELGIDLRKAPDIGLTDPREKVRLMGEVIPGAYFDFFNSLGWSVVEESYTDEYKLGEKSFDISSSYGHIPVYITTLTQTPLDTQDGTSEKVKEVVLKNAMKDSRSPTIVLMWGKFLTREIKGKNYTCGGCIYRNGIWRDFLIGSSMKKIEDLIDSVAKDFDYNNPGEGLVDHGKQVLYLFLAVSHGLDDMDELNNYRMQLAGGASGWYAVFLIPKD